MPAPTEYTLTTRQVAEQLGISDEAVYRAVKTGQIPCIRTPGGHRRFRPKDIDRYLLGVERQRDKVRAAAAEGWD